MSYDFKIITSTDYTPTYWSGGCATELTTYPKNSSFANRDFLWRLGFAKIDIDTSTFSSLPGIKRHLMVTDGKMILTHKDKYSKELIPYSQDFFMGNWITTTQGRCSVFNLMTRENYDGELSHISISSNSTYNFNKCNFEEIKDQIISICFYAVKGSFNITINSTTITINPGDLFVALPNDHTNFSLNLCNDTKTDTDIITAIITKTE